jgi:hypothetical protein
MRRLVGGVVSLLDGSADPAAVGDLMAVDSGPFADLGQLVLVGAAAGDAACVATHLATGWGSALSAPAPMQVAAFVAAFSARPGLAWPARTRRALGWPVWRGFSSSR